MCEAPSDVVSEPELHEFCASYLERRLGREKEERDVMAEMRSEQRQQQQQQGGEGDHRARAAAMQCATDSGEEPVIFPSYTGSK